VPQSELLAVAPLEVKQEKIGLLSVPRGFLQIEASQLSPPEESGEIQLNPGVLPG